MKKILILLLCIYVVPVSALEYSDYTPFSDYTEEYIESDDLTDVKVERRYKYYRNTKILGSYEKINTENEEYPYTDYDDFTYTEESGYLIGRPKEVEGRVITEINGKQYQKARDVTYLKFNNDTSNSIDIKEFNLKYKEKPINYTLEFKDASMEKLGGNGYIIYKFKEPLVLNDLNLSLKVSSNEDSKFTITTGTETMNVSTGSYTFKNDYELNIYLRNTTINNSCYVNYFVPVEEQITTSRAMIFFQNRPLYTYKDIMYRKYKIEKEYYPEYLASSVDDYINKDEEDYKDFYAKRTRTILEEIIDNQNNDLIKEENTALSESKEEKKEEKVKTSKTILKTVPEKQINITKDMSSIGDYLEETEDFSNYGYLPIKTSSNSPEITNTKTQLWYFIGPIIILFCILILLLSKLYKKEDECAKV